MKNRQKMVVLNRSGHSNSSMKMSAMHDNSTKQYGYRLSLEKVDAYTVEDEQFLGDNKMI